MRCYYDPPLAQVLGTIPSRLQGGPPQLLIAGISPEVHEDRFCRHHPAITGESLTGLPEVVGMPKTTGNGIVVPGSTEVQ